MFESCNLYPITYNLCMKEESFHDKLKRLIHEYVMLTYGSTKKYPNDERFGLTSQDRRAGVSIMLNYVEGFA